MVSLGHNESELIRWKNIVEQVSVFQLIPYLVMPCDVTWYFFGSTTNAAVQTSLDRLHPFIKNSIGHGLIPAELWALIVGHVVAKVIVWEVAEVKVIKKAIRVRPGLSNLSS